MNDSSIIAAYFGLPLVFVIALYLMRQQSKNKAAAEVWGEAKAAGLTEPASLHPDIDPNLCLGCAACVSACPEGKILGVIDRKAILVSPTSCIGHGVCKEVCPADAITLVFGTEKRGVEIPLIKEFETSVPGIFIAGELGGMGLIRNAIAQGTQAVEAVVNKKSSASCDLDLVIVGAGPAGLSAALTAADKKLRYVVLEQDTAGGTVAHYPRGKIVMTAPAVLPIVGKFQFREASKEALVEFWDAAISKGNLKIRTGESVTDIEKQSGGGFLVKTPKGEYSTKAVVLSMGRRGTPRKLGVEGEEQTKVVYRLIDPDQYKGKHVLVVGGGDSALEAALSCAGGGAASTALAYRSEAFSRAKPKNRTRVEKAGEDGTINVMMSTVVKSIGEKDIIMKAGDNETTLPNDAVIVCAGGILPTPFLKKIGVEVEEKFGTA